MARCRESARHRPLETDPRAVCKLARSYDRRHSVRLGKFSRLSRITSDYECCQKCCRPNVISVVCEGGVYHGFAVDSRGVFIHDNEHGAGVKRYAGRIGFSGKGYRVSSLGVLTLLPGLGIVYGEHGRFGEVDGRSLHALSDRVVYRVYEGGDLKASAVKHATGRCTYNDEICAPHHPPFLAIIAQVGPVEVRPATAAPSPGLATLSRRSTRGFALGLPPAGARDSCRQRGTLPRRTPSLVGVRHRAQ